MSETRELRKDVLIKGFEDMVTLLRYLYLGNTVVYHNSCNAPIELSMNEKLVVRKRNLNFPDNGPTYAADECMPMNLNLIIEQLGEEPAVEYPSNYDNRWAEVKAITEMQVGLNKIHYKVPEGVNEVCRL